MSIGLIKDYKNNMMAELSCVFIRMRKMKPGEIRR